MKKESVQKALGFLTLAMYYHNLTINVLEKMNESSNPHIIMSNKDTVDKYDELTKWSDFRIFIPTLFLFYHGLELSLKGMLTFHEKVVTNHSLKNLLFSIREIQEIPHSIEEISKRHIEDESINDILKSFMDVNKLSVDELYMALRYPTDKRLIKDYSYFELKYKESEIIPYINLLISDCENLKTVTGEYYSRYRHLIMT